MPVPGRTGCFILSEELILHFLPLLYKGYKVTSKTLARITRNADIDADLIYDEDLNYRDHMAEVVKKRKKLAPVRLELSREIDEEIIQSLCKNLKLNFKRVFEYDSRWITLSCSRSRISCAATPTCSLRPATRSPALHWTSASPSFRRSWKRTS